MAVIKLWLNPPWLIQPNVSKSVKTLAGYPITRYSRVIRVGNSRRYTCACAWWCIENPNMDNHDDEQVLSTIDLIYITLWGKKLKSLSEPVFPSPDNKVEIQYERGRPSPTIAAYSWVDSGLCSKIPRSFWGTKPQSREHVSHSGRSRDDPPNIPLAPKKNSSTLHIHVLSKEVRK